MQMHLSRGRETGNLFGMALSETLPSASIKATNEAVHAGHFETTEIVTEISALRPHGITIFADICSGE